MGTQGRHTRQCWDCASFTQIKRLPCLPSTHQTSTQAPRLQIHRCVRVPVPLKEAVPFLPAVLLYHPSHQADAGIQCGHIICNIRKRAEMWCVSSQM